MVKKSFFRKRTPEEISGLNPKRIYIPRGLVEKIWNLGDNESLELRFPLIPLHFRSGVQSQARASRRDYKHGALIHVHQPETREQAYSYPYIPLTARMKAFDEAIRELKEEEINFIGLCWHPVQSLDRRWRVTPFDVSIEGTKIYDYALNRVGGIPVQEKYAKSEIVQREGGQIFCKVPSRTKGRERYHVVLMNVPTKQGDEKKAIVWGLKSNYEDGREPERRTFLHHLRYEWRSGSRTSDIFVFSPHDVAAYLAAIRRFWDGLKNTVPLEMNPFPLPSRQWARFYDLSDNNVVIYDPTLESKTKLRNLHLDEKCILLSRSIKVKGPYETAFWDPKRDGPLRNYWR